MKLEDFPDNSYNKYCWMVTPEGIRIGKGCWIGAFTLIDGTGKLTIGKEVTISSGAQIITHSGVHRCISERKYNKIDQAPSVIEDHVFVGANATILMGCKIGHHSVVGAGSVIPQFSNFPPYSIITGVPGVITGNSRKFIND